MAKRYSRSKSKAQPEQRLNLMMVLLSLLLVVSLIQTVQLLGMTKTPTASVVYSEPEQSPDCRYVHVHNPEPPYEPIYIHDPNCLR